MIYKLETYDKVKKIWRRSWSRNGGGINSTNQVDWCVAMAMPLDMVTVPVNKTTTRSQHRYGLVYFVACCVQKKSYVIYIFWRKRWVSSVVISLHSRVFVMFLDEWIELWRNQISYFAVILIIGGICEMNSKRQYFWFDYCMCISI